MTSYTHTAVWLTVADDVKFISSKSSISVSIMTPQQLCCDSGQLYVSTVQWSWSDHPRTCGVSYRLSAVQRQPVQDETLCPWSQQWVWLSHCSKHILITDVSQRQNRGHPPALLQETGSQTKTEESYKSSSGENKPSLSHTHRVVST